MNKLCDFQAQFDCDDSLEGTRKRAKSSFKSEIRRPKLINKELFPHQLGFFRKDLKSNANIKSLQRRFIPIQSVLPTLKADRTSKSVKDTYNAKRFSKVTGFVKKRSFVGSSDRASLFFRFQNYYLQHID